MWVPTSDDESCCIEQRTRSKIMQNVTVYYRAEVDYRHEQVAREFRPSRVRRALRIGRAAA